MFNKSLNVQDLKIDKDSNGHLITCDFVLNDSKFSLFNIYAPNDDDPECFIDMFEKIQQNTSDYLLIGGDSSKVLNVELDKSGGRNIVTRSAQVINSFLEENDWSDLWRNTHDNIFQFTWRRRKPNIMTRLDYFLAPISMLGLVEQCQILPAVLSDHCPVQLDLIMSDQVKGPGYWKFNTRHLYSKEFIEKVNKIIDFADFRYSELNPLNKWEMIKHDIREFTLCHSKKVASEK